MAGMAEEGLVEGAEAGNHGDDDDGACGGDGAYGGGDDASRGHTANLQPQVQQWGPDISKCSAICT